MPSTWKNIRITLVSVLFSGLSLSGFAQSESPQNDRATRFGEVAVADFSPSPAGSDANAVVLAEIGSTTLEGYEEGFRIVFTVFRRIKILRSKGLEAASVKVEFSEEGNGSKKVRGLKACTYNLENGQIVRTPLERKDHFNQKQDEDEVMEKFTLPNAKPGSIIEYTYSLRSPNYFHLHPWYFQGEYPTVYSSYTVKIPDIFNFVFLAGGRRPDTTITELSHLGTTVAGYTYFETHIQTTTWIMKNIPPIHEGPFMSTLRNVIARIRFQLSINPISAKKAENVLGDWQTASDRLLSDSRFGVPITEKPAWLKDSVKKIIVGTKDTLEMAKRIYRYVRDNYKSEGADDGMSSGATLKDIYTRKSGSVGDLNLLLIAMLRLANITVDPVILSTKEHGLTNSTYPIIGEYNYLVAKASISNTSWYLDASVRWMGFGRLPLKCYNGHARVISKNNYAIFLEPDSLTETKMTTAFIVNDGDQLDGNYTIVPGYFESLNIRKELATSSVKEYLGNQAKTFPAETKLDTTASIDAIQVCDTPVTLHYGIRMAFNGEAIAYFNPMLNAALKKNPFEAAERSYPVEMPYRKDDTYVLNMEIPKGYTVEELPKSARVNLNGDDGGFEYIIGLNGDHIQLKSRIRLKKAIFEPEDYATLREFYAFIVKKQSEMIVFKRVVN